MGWGGGESGEEEASAGTLVGGEGLRFKEKPVELITVRHRNTNHDDE